MLNETQPPESAADIPAKLRQDIRTEAAAVYHGIIKGLPSDPDGTATPEQISAVYEAAEKYGINKQYLRNTYERKDGTEATLKDTFCSYYTRAKIARLRQAGELPPAPAIRKSSYEIIDRYTNAQTQAIINRISETGQTDKALELLELAKANDNAGPVIDEWLNANGFKELVIKNRRRYINPGGRPKKSAPTESEPEPAAAEAPADQEPAPETDPSTEPDTLPTDQADQYTAEELNAIGYKLINYSKSPALDIGNLLKHANECNNDRTAVNNWLIDNGLGHAIPGNSPAEQYIRRQAETPAGPAETETETETAPAAEIPDELTPAEDTEAGTESAPAPAPAATIPPNLDEHKKALNYHIANIINGKQRAAFYKERDEILAITAADPEIQDAEILTLCLKVKEAETAQSRKPEPEPLTIRDEEAGQVIDGGTGDIITGPKAEETAKELDTAAEARKLIQAHRQAIPPHLRTEAARDFKQIRTPGGQLNPNHISLIPTEPRYFLRTKNDTDLAKRIRTETDGYLLNDTQKTFKGSEEPRAYWRYWNGTAFIGDSELTDAAVLRAIETLNEEYNYLYEQGADPAALKQFQTFINKSKDDKSIAAAMNRLRKLNGVSIDFDIVANQSLISLKNIIFNTTTGEIISANDPARISEIKSQYPYHYIESTYDPNAHPVKYLNMVYTFFYDNTTPGLSDAERDRRAKEATAWYIRYRGYVLFAGNPEQINLFFIGDAQAGKTTLIRASGKPLKDEYGELDHLNEIYAGFSGVPESYTNLAPKRECLIDEGAGSEERGEELSSEFFKRTTTAKTTSGLRGLYQHAKERPHNLKRTFSMNEAPHFDKGMDGGTLRRMVVIPSNHKYDEAERITDYEDLIIAEEGEAILSLMINECINYIHGNPNAPAGSAERKAGLLPIPEYWQRYKAQILGGPIYSAFLLDNYEPITDIHEKTEENKVFKDELYGELIAYARANHCIDELGKLIDAEEPANDAPGERTGDTKYRKTLNKNAAKQLRAALIQLGYGDFKAVNHPRPYIYATYKGLKKRSGWTF